jgi:hypothetical protein
VSRRYSPVRRCALLEAYVVMGGVVVESDHLEVDIE